MNLLIEPLPKTLWIEGKEYPIRWDFRVGILYELLMLDETVERGEKPLLALRLFYGEIPNNRKEALEGILWFYRLGKEEGNADAKKEHYKQERIYSFEQDASFILSAFWEQYGINLNAANLHWWQFRALFLGIGENTIFYKIMSYRSIKITEGMTNGQIEFYRRMKEIYRLPIAMEEKEKFAEIEHALLHGGDLTGLL